MLCNTGHDAGDSGGLSIQTAALPPPFPGVRELTMAASFFFKVFEIVRLEGWAPRHAGCHEAPGRLEQVLVNDILGENRDIP